MRSVKYLFLVLVCIRISISFLTIELKNLTHHLSFIRYYNFILVITLHFYPITLIFRKNSGFKTQGGLILSVPLFVFFSYIYFYLWIFTEIQIGSNLALFENRTSKSKIYERILLDEIGNEYFHRIVNVYPINDFLIIVRDIDTNTIDKSKWIIIPKKR